jgi:chaperonin GroEL (HSP60 family)
LRGALEAPLKGSEMGRKGVKSSDIIEPLAVKLQIVSASAEAACMILRIDDVITTQKSGGGPPGGGEGGMPPTPHLLLTL